MAGIIWPTTGEVGEYAANSGVDLVVTLGEACRSLAEGVRAVKEIPVVEFSDCGEMVKYLETEIRDGDCVLFKGSNSMGLSAVADQSWRWPEGRNGRKF